MIGYMLSLLITVVAVSTDLKTDRIPNIWIVFGYSLAITYRVLNQDPLLPCWIGMGVPIILLGGLFFFHMMGAGDIKLLSVLGAFMGVPAILYCILWSMVFGAAISILILFHRRIWRVRFQFLFHFVQNFFKGERSLIYMGTKPGRESMHFTLPVLLSLLLWIGGVYR